MTSIKQYSVAVTVEATLASVAFSKKNDTCQIKATLFERRLISRTSVACFPEIMNQCFNQEKHD